MNGQTEKGMSVIVKTVTRLSLGFILLYGVYITLNGHVSPGGGFAGGVIVALSLVHVMLAFGKETALKRLGAGILRFLVSMSAVIFLLIVATSFLGGRIPIDKEIVVPLCEMVIVGGGLFVVFIALVLLSKADKDSE